MFCFCSDQGTYSVSSCQVIFKVQLVSHIQIHIIFYTILASLDCLVEERIYRLSTTSTRNWNNCWREGSYGCLHLDPAQLLSEGLHLDPAHWRDLQWGVYIWTQPSRSTTTLHQPHPSSQVLASPELWTWKLENPESLCVLITFYHHQKPE